MGHCIADGTCLGPVDYHRLVEALGGFGLAVERPEEIRPALEAAFASGRTACINVAVDPSVISPGASPWPILGATGNRGATLLFKGRGLREGHIGDFFGLPCRRSVARTRTVEPKRLFLKLSG